MAPVPLKPELDDDFIRTISDDDEYGILPGEEGEVPHYEHLKVFANGKKRTHNQIDDGEESSAFKIDANPRDQKRQKAHSQTKATNKLSKADFESRGEEDDDGSIDSDFEFQVDKSIYGSLEEIDVWDYEEKKPQKVAKSGKKGVDIDALIAKRRNQESEKSHNNGKENDLSAVTELQLEDGHEDSESDVSGSVGADSEDQDQELLAEDAFGMGADVEEHEEDENSEPGDESDSVSDDHSVADPMPELEESENSGDDHDSEEEERRKSFFAPEEPVPSKLLNGKANDPKSFQSMSLSRPILRGLASIGFTNPTPIQSRTIPIALQGKDVVGGAVTGSGKTAAFFIPILERLLYRPKKVPTTRVAILIPTRELAVQCLGVAKKLASFTDITLCLLIGGFSLREQENALRSRPDIIIATPGRFIDHMRNTASFASENLEILVLDEADRMLDDGFADELNEILNTIPKSRQTMLFSATMTDRVDNLIRAGLKRPVRIMADALRQTVGTLTQEFVRLRPGREDKRIGYLMHLCSSIYKERVIVFFRQKKEAHRVRIIFGLSGMKATELHGSMTQEQRIHALDSFRTGQASHLLATDLASRGLDIPHVSVVINYEAPQSHEIYLHRVGRTARAGRSGRSCTIAAESDRKVVKEAVKAAKTQGAKVISRLIEAALADEWASKIATLDEEVEAILKDEKEDKLLNQSDMSIRKGENMIKFEDEIHARPKRTWFESEKEKLKAKKAGKEELNGRVGLSKGKPQKKLSGKEKKGLDDRRDRLEGRMWKKGKDSGRIQGKNSLRPTKSKSRSKGKTGTRPARK